MSLNPTNAREDEEIELDEPEYDEDRIRASLFDDQDEDIDDDAIIEDIDLDDLAAMEGPDA